MISTFSAGEFWGLLDASLRSETGGLVLVYLKTYCPEEGRTDGKSGMKPKTRKNGWVTSRRRHSFIHQIVFSFVTFWFVRLTLVCEDVMLPGCRPSRDFWLLCGVPFRGETYGRGDDASDVRETGD